MTTLLGLSLLLVLAVLPIRAAPLTGLEPVPCDETGAGQAARLTLQQINQHHYHGYKFNLDKVASVAVTKSETECVLELQLDLLETVCHVIDPKPYDECKVRPTHETQVKAHCDVIVAIVNGNGTVTKYECYTHPVPAENVTGMCPDCPTLLPLNHRKGLEAVRDAEYHFHEVNNHIYMWKLLDVGRLTSGYMMSSGMYYTSEFVLVETPFARGTKQELMLPYGGPSCSDAARHAVCSSTVTKKDQVSVSCVVYEARNSSSSWPKCQAPRFHNHRAPPTPTPAPSTVQLRGRFMLQALANPPQPIPPIYSNAKIHSICSFPHSTSCGELKEHKM